MSGPEQFNAAAVTAPNLSGDFAAAYGVNFPSTDTLEKTSFKAVVGSWRRLNRATSTTNDFEVDLSEYAPKQSFITRVQLVDVDIPHTQLLVEETWNRVYFSLGCRSTPECRTLNVSLSNLLDCSKLGMVVNLPLQLDPIRSFELISPSYIRLYTQHRAPSPIVPLAHAWQSLNKIGYGRMVLTGIPGMVDYELSYDTVSDDSNMSFVVNDMSLYTLLAALSVPPPQLYLVATTLPGPSFLSKILSRAITYEFNQNFASSQLCDQANSWVFNIVYSGVGDTFELNVRTPAPSRITLDGPLADYMGFGSPYYLDTPERVGRTTCSGQFPRFQQGDSFAAIQSGDPLTDTQLSTWVADAFSAYVWNSFTFKLVFPALVVTVSIPGGIMSLEQVARVIETKLSDPLNLLAGQKPISVSVVLTPYPGLAFKYNVCDDVEGDLFAFGLDFSTAGSGLDARRLGYDNAAYPIVLEHLPVRCAKHVPLLPGMCGVSCCSPVLYTVPQGIVNVSFREEMNQLVFESRPYTPFSVFSITLVSGSYTIVAASGYNANMFVGCEVMLWWATSFPAYYQIPAVVTATNASDLTTFTIALMNPDDATVISSAANVTCVPQTAQPLVLYMQRSPTDQATLACTVGCAFPRRYGRTIDPEILGFNALTYESCGKVLASPGTLEIRQDANILLCLAFSAGGAPPVTGDVYYPLGTQNTIIFAKVLRGSVFLRADFDRCFDHYFAGSGIHLGYIRVKIMNPNGTPYESHGHAISITLKFECRTTAIAFGGGHNVVPGESSVSMVPLARGTMISRHYGGGSGQYSNDDDAMLDFQI